MTAHDFAVGVLQWLIVLMAILGVALALERIFKTRRPRYWMARDVHDLHRRNARNGVRAWLGFR